MTDVKKVQEVVDTLDDKRKKWLEQCAAEHDVDLDTLLTAARTWVELGQYECIGVDIDYEKMSGEFWEHYQAYTMEQVPKEKQNNFFSCSC